MWHLLRSKSHWIIGQKSRTFDIYYGRVFSKKATLSNVTHIFLSKSLLINGQKSPNIAWYRRRFLGEKTTFRGARGVSICKGGGCYCITPPPRFSRENLILVKIYKILIKIQRAFERISYNVQILTQIFSYFNKNSTISSRFWMTFWAYNV